MTAAGLDRHLQRQRERGQRLGRKADQRGETGTPWADAGRERAYGLRSLGKWASGSVLLLCLVAGAGGQER